MRALVLAALVLLSGASAGAQTGVVFNRSGSGARAAGMANAFIAVSDDGTAASWNPAGLAQLRLPELSIVSTTSGNSFVSQNFRTLDGSALYSPARSAYQDTYLDFTSLALPVTIAGKPVSFQAAWRRQYELDYREISSITRRPVAPNGPPLLRFDDNHDVVGSVDLVSLAAAARLTERLSLGGSANFWRGDWTETSNGSQTPLDPVAATRFTTTSQSNRIRGVNVSAGLMLTYPRWSVGAVHQTALRSDYSGVGRITSSAGPGPEPLAFDGTLYFPRSFGVGAAFRPAPLWTVALDLTRDEWRDAYADVGFGPESIFDGLPKDLTTTRDTVSVNAGAERLFVADGHVIPLRFGVAYEPQGWRSPYTLGSADYVMWAVGTGFNTNSLKLDAGFQLRRATFQDGIVHELDGSPLRPDAVGERIGQEWRVKVSLILRLQEPEKLRELVKKIF
jgi:long-subunit fatty acid transport protein